jgi:hypothetical protein
MDWPGHKRQRSTLKLYRNNRNGAFTDVTERAGLFADTAMTAGVGQASRDSLGFGCAFLDIDLAYGDFDRDGDVDLLLTTNQGAAHLYRNDVAAGARSLRLRLTGTKSNRDAIGAVVRLTTQDATQMRTVKTGSSYFSQSELTLTFGLGPRDAATRIVVDWPSGTVQEFTKVAAGAWECVEGAQLRRVQA